MARAFASASSQNLSVASAAVTDVPLTMACWWQGPTSGVSILMFLSDGGTTNKITLNTGNASSKVSAFYAAASATTSTTFTASTWNHACGVYSAVNSRSVFLNGGGKGTNTTSTTVTGINTTHLASNPTPANFLNGKLAEVAIWNIALTDAEVAILGSTTNPISPLLMHPEALVFYAPLLSPVTNPEPERVGARNLTPSVSAPTLTDHPRIFYPSVHQFRRFSVQAVQVNIDSWFQRSEIPVDNIIKPQIIGY